MLLDPTVKGDTLPAVNVPVPLTLSAPCSAAGTKKVSGTKNHSVNRGVAQMGFFVKPADDQAFEAHSGECQMSRSSG